MKKLKTWQIVLLVIFYPIGICVWIYRIRKKIQIKKDKKHQWYEKEQYYGIQVKIQKEILYPDQNLEKEKQKEILFCLVKS